MKQLPAARAADPEGLVLQLQRMSTEDGPGLRTTAFLKGCPLACAWCHNPESISPRPELQWIGSRCVACGACLAACPKTALSRSADGAVAIDRRACSGCGLCAEACPSCALELLGTRYAASRLAAELAKDAAYYAGSDRGGITLSGGEASAQGSFAREVFRLCSESGLHTALDTCGVASWEVLASLYPHVDLLLWDLKEADPERHREHAGLGNEPVLENLARTAAYMATHDRPRALWLRTPVIPGATDREDNLAELGRIVARIAPPRLERWELCAFNNLCADKYRRLGREWAYASAPLVPRERMDALVEAARRGLAEGRTKGGDGARRALGETIVSWTGSARLEQVSV